MYFYVPPLDLRGETVYKWTGSTNFQFHVHPSAASAFLSSLALQVEEFMPGDMFAENIYSLFASQLLLIRFSPPTTSGARLPNLVVSLQVSDSHLVR